MASIADRIRRLEHDRAERAASFAERKRLAPLDAAVRISRLCLIAHRLNPQTSLGRRAWRVAELVQIGLTRYVRQHDERISPPPLKGNSP